MNKKQSSVNAPLIQNPLLGSDCEVFLAHKETGEIVSAEGYIDGTKHDPHRWDASSPFFMTSLDNVLAEFGIPPTNNLDEWIAYFKKTFDYLNKKIPGELCTVSLPAAILDDKYLQTENAKLFGCEPDYNVWTRSTNPKPCATNQNLRSAGFHVHFGYDNPNMETSEKIVKACDVFMGVPSVLIEPDNERKKLYGKAGCFRFKPEYGLEYRVLSSFFSSSDELLAWVFKQGNKVVDFVNNGRADELDSMATQIQEAINKADKVLAGNIIRQFDVELV